MCARVSVCRYSTIRRDRGTLPTPEDEGEDDEDEDDDDVAAGVATAAAAAFLPAAADLPAAAATSDLSAVAAAPAATDDTGACTDSDADSDAHTTVRIAISKRRSAAFGSVARSKDKASRYRSLSEETHANCAARAGGGCVCACV